MWGKFFGQTILVLTCGLILAILLIFLDRQSGVISNLPLVSKVFPYPDYFTYGSIPNLKDEEYFSKVKQDYVDRRESFVEADLSKMILRVYKKGEVVLEVPIKTKGREGSWWETPAGIYQAVSKEENHLSSLGQTYMPWSIAFQGNFFIHGWPYYRDGTPVATTYSGGCVRLSTPDAEKVFRLVDVKMPILVFEDSFKPDTTAYTPGHSQVSAESYLLGDLKNDFIFTSKHKDEAVPVASVTKLVTAMVAVEYMDIEKRVTVREGAIVNTSVPRLKAGQVYTIYDLLYPLLQESSNEAGLAISQALGEKYFVSLMNKKARSIGMTGAEFVDPSGIGAGNVATPIDLFRLGKYLYNSRQFVLNLTAGTAKTNVYGLPKFSGVENFNLFNGDPRFVGGKVGQSTPAGHTGVFVFEVPFGAQTRPIVVVLLNSKDLRSDTEKLLKFTTDNYRLENGAI